LRSSAVTRGGRCVSSLNATQAALAAGYAKSSAKVRGHEMRR
jgi:phage terminase small subunit